MCTARSFPRFVPPFSVENFTATRRIDDAPAANLAKRTAISRDLNLPASKFLLDTNEPLAKNASGSKQSPLTISTRCKWTAYCAQINDSPAAIAGPSEALFNPQPRRLETAVNHRKQAPMQPLYRQHSRTSGDKIRARAYLTAFQAETSIVFSHSPMKTSSDR